MAPKKDMASASSRGLPARAVVPVAENVARATPQGVGEVSQAVSGTDLLPITAESSQQSRGSTSVEVVDYQSPSMAARGYSWPPFEAGNMAAAKHGAFSPRQVQPIAAHLAKQLRADHDWLRTARFADALNAYTMTLARVELLEAWIAGLTVDEAADAGTRKNSPLETLRQLVRRSMTLGDRLGLNPSTAWEVEDDIAASQLTLARRAERKRLAADLKASLRAEQDER
jgi:hypothetical protein